jgi:hypothetical protein
MTYYEEALSHCRWKKQLLHVTKLININDYKNKNFEEIFLMIYNITKNINGVGVLSTYDLSSGICKYYNIKIDKVYIIGNGPKRAIKILGINPQRLKIGDISINFININDIINAFEHKLYDIPTYIKLCDNGDTIESFICNWQKTIF